VLFRSVSENPVLSSDSRYFVENDIQTQPLNINCRIQGDIISDVRK